MMKFKEKLFVLNATEQRNKARINAFTKAQKRHREAAVSKPKKNPREGK